MTKVEDRVPYSKVRKCFHGRQNEDVDGVIYENGMIGLKKISFILVKLIEHCLRWKIKLVMKICDFYILLLNLNILNQYNLYDIYLLKSTVLIKIPNFTIIQLLFQSKPDKKTLFLKVVERLNFEFDLDVKI